MDEPDADLFADIALELHQQANVERTLERIVEYAQDATGCDEAGVMLLRARGRIETAFATHSRVAEADRLQMDIGEGPCLQAMWDHDIFRVDDTSSDPRWPTWGPKAADLGLCSLLAVRLFTPQQTIGALNLYGEQLKTFTDDDVDVADIFGRHASVALAASREEAGLREAIGARHLIGLAQGILMERHGLDADRAFQVLRRYSQQHNVKLREVAELVVETRQLPPPREPR
ncbi:GAF and ANTAR domain-containing protein [Phytoactinopolyspora limicola]|uniref:GAF and ANTAR domain-containing protein n=1 Tax=Phytoactinopolyspora limicola TaxID=2715536 RepID=UPI0014095C99|nr:ANTAR domain-containing protein [Phytoactinopolyspora limicola]